MYEVSEQEALANGDEILAIVSESSAVNHHENTAEMSEHQHHEHQLVEHGGVEVDETGFEWSVTYGIDGAAEAASTLTAPSRK
jgi:hypothetical protein